MFSNKPMEDIGLVLGTSSSPKDGTFIAASVPGDEAIGKLLASQKSADNPGYDEFADDTPWAGEGQYLLCGCDGCGVPGSVPTGSWPLAALLALYLLIRRGTGQRLRQQARL